MDLDALRAKAKAADVEYEAEAEARRAAKPKLVYRDDICVQCGQKVKGTRVWLNRARDLYHVSCAKKRITEEQE